MRREPALPKFRPGTDKAFRKIRGGWTTDEQPATGHHWSGSACPGCRTGNNANCRTCNGSRQVFYQRKSR